MHQRFRLSLNRSNKPLVTVTQQIDRDTRGKVEITRAIFVYQVAMFPTHRTNAAPGIYGHQRGNRHEDNSIPK